MIWSIPRIIIMIFGDYINRFSGVDWFISLLFLRSFSRFIEFACYLDFVLYMGKGHTLFGFWTQQNFFQ